MATSSYLNLVIFDPLIPIIEEYGAKKYPVDKSLSLCLSLSLFESNPMTPVRRSCVCDGGRETVSCSPYSTVMQSSYLVLQQTADDTRRWTAGWRMPDG